MGSDKKSKDKKHRKRPTSSSESEDGGRRKRRKSIGDEEEKSKRNEKGESKSSHKHSKRHSDKEKKSKDKDKGKHPTTDQNPKYEFHELSKDDYFSKNKEFSTWLKEKKKVFFNDLSAESAREMFGDFIKTWNRQKLDSKYYEGIVSAPRSAHTWKFKD